MSNVTDLHQCKASAVPSIPKTISATQRIAALELAQRLEDITDAVSDRQANRLWLALTEKASAMLRELANDRIACNEDIGFNMRCRRQRGHVGPHAKDPKVLFGEEPV